MATWNHADDVSCFKSHVHTHKMKSQTGICKVKNVRTVGFLSLLSLSARSLYFWNLKVTLIVCPLVAFRAFGVCQALCQALEIWLEGG